MFLVNDTKEERRKKITRFLDSGETVIAVLLAAANFEWTVRRTIIALGKSPTARYREEKGLLSGCHGLKAYKEVWKSDVSPRTGKGLAQVICKWQYLKEQAYPLRNKLIHGDTGTVTPDYAKPRVEAMLAASEDLIEYGLDHDGDVFQRIRIRRKPR